MHATDLRKTVEVSPSEMLQALALAERHTKKYSEQQEMALCIMDWAVQESTRVTAEALRIAAHTIHLPRDTITDL